MPGLMPTEGGWGCRVPSLHPVGLMVGIWVLVGK